MLALCHGESLRWSVSTVSSPGRTLQRPRLSHSPPATTCIPVTISLETSVSGHSHTNWSNLVVCSATSDPSVSCPLVTVSVCILVISPEDGGTEFTLGFEDSSGSSRSKNTNLLDIFRRRRIMPTTTALAFKSTIRSSV